MKQPVRAKNVAVAVESQKTSKCLDGDSGAWDGVLPRYRTTQIHFERLPSAAVQLREQVAVVEKVSSKDLGDREHKMTMPYRFDHFLAKPLTKLQQPLLVARRTEVTAFAQESQEILKVSV